MKFSIQKIGAASLLSLMLLTGCGGTAAETEDHSTATVVSVGSAVETSSVGTTVDSTKWELMLVNFAHKIDSSYEVTTKELPGGASVDERIYDAAMQMLNDCAAEGYNPGVSSAYRNVQWQTDLYNAEIQGFISQGYSEDEAKELAKTEVAEPGTSEHHTGLAMDMIADGNVELEESFEDTDVGKWLKENSWKYGFILRFPKGKENITGVIYEPWHFRYVGKEAAKEITERGICLEEYLGVIDTPSDSAQNLTSGSSSDASSQASSDAEDTEDDNYTNENDYTDDHTDYEE